MPNQILDFLDKKKIAMGKIGVYWIALALLQVPCWANTLSGVVDRADSSGVPIAGATVSVSIDNETDTTTTNNSGQYSIPLVNLNCCRTYIIGFSAPHFKDSLGDSVRTVSVTPESSTTVINVNLYPATSSITANMMPEFLLKTAMASVIAFSAPLIVRFILQHQATSQDAWISLDTGITDSNSNSEDPSYTFSNLITATGGTGGGYYRISDSVIKAQQANVRCNVNSQDSSEHLTLGEGTVASYNFTALCDASIVVSSSSSSPQFYFFIIGDKLILNLAPSHFPRILNLLDLKGALQLSVQIQPEESRIELPASFAPERGYIFDLK
jgi:hypothetical protein